MVVDVELGVRHVTHVSRADPAILNDEIVTTMILEVTIAHCRKTIE